MKRSILAVSLLASLTTAAHARPQGYRNCWTEDRVYEESPADSAYTLQAVYRCGGSSTVDRKWVCRTNPTITGSESYQIPEPRCPGKSEYQELIEKGMEVQK